MLDTVRARLTLWYVSLLAAILVVVLVMVYVLLARALYVRIDDSLQAVVQIATTSLAYAVSISDQGPGIAAEVQSRIFERFYRVDAARTHDGVSDGGAGLGLALAKWIAHVHGGDITLAASSRLGSTFVITLPTPA